MEDPAYWRDVHGHLMAHCADMINERLPSGFRAALDERLYIEPSQRHVMPDVVVTRRHPEQKSHAAAGGTMTADRVSVFESVTLLSDPVRESFVEIVTVGKPRRVVTVIEVLTPANKAQGSTGREKYLDKQESVLNSEVNLLEIDLLRGGAYTVAVPQNVVAGYGEWDYLVCLNRATDRMTYDFWRTSLRERLPSVRVPLTEENADIMLDLQIALEKVYRNGRYEEELDYSAEPPVPVVGEDAVWMDALLREKGLRGTP